MVEAPNSAQADVLSFSRTGEDDGLFAVFNLSDRPQRVSFGPSPHLGTYRALETRLRSGPDAIGADFLASGASLDRPPRRPVGGALASALFLRRRVPQAAARGGAGASREAVR